MLSELNEDEIFKRKCKNSSLTSTQSNEKRQKVYRKHPYARKIDFAYVNDYCLSELFMYIPVCERPKIAQVCKNWNRVLYSSCLKFQKIVSSHWEYDCPQNYLEKFKTSDKKFRFLRSLISKSFIDITELDLVAYEDSNIVSLLNEYCPSLVKLRLRLKYPFDKGQLENAFSRMSKLRVLKILFQHLLGVPKVLIISLKNVASTLNELVLTHKSKDLDRLCQLPDSFSTVICRLKALKRLETGGMLITDSILRAIVRAKLDFYNHETVKFKIPGEPKYWPVSLSRISLAENEKLTDDILYSFANNLKCLQTIDGNCSLVTDAGIRAIAKLDNLKCLYLTGKSHHITDSSLILLKKLTRLELPDSDKITKNSVETIFVNSPDMQELLFRHTNVTPEFIITAKKVSEKRKAFCKLYVRFSSCCVGLIKSEHLFVHCLCCVETKIDKFIPLTFYAI